MSSESIVTFKEPGNSVLVKTILSRDIGICNIFHPESLKPTLLHSVVGFCKTETFFLSWISPENHLASPYSRFRSRNHMVRMTKFGYSPDFECCFVLFTDL